MKQMIRQFQTLLIAVGLFFSVALQPAGAAEQTIHILCTTFPIYQITRNVTEGRDIAQVKLMLPAQLGCPHDYALTPGDMRLLTTADVLVINGLGMEEFLGTPLRQARPQLTIIDSSAGVNETLTYTDSPGQKDHDDHDHQGINPHLFASPRLVAKLAMNIARGLTKIDPAGAELYRRNSQAYALKIDKLNQEVVAVGKHLKNKRIITQHGIFDYLARDMGLEVVAVVEAHAGQEPSAAEMLDIIKTATAMKAGGIFSEPQYPARVVQTIAKETGIKAADLDPVATGPENAPLDYYEVVMRHNLETLKSVLGTE
jgi:zinc transport system substrate-binding protein